jgi:hypothetical protein
LSGDMMITASTGIAQACYDIQWYKCNMKVRRAILLIMIRAQRKVNVKIPFLEISLETFGNVRVL